MKFCLTDTMRAMNCTVLLIKILTFYMIWKSKEIGSVLVKFSLLAYLVLMPFCDELYTNITNLQWWLIYLMIIVFMRHETSLTGLLLSCSLLALSGLTGVNSVLLTVPCAYMVLRLRTKNCLIKVFVIIVCALVQLYYVHSTPRVGGKLYGNVFDIIDMFVNRVIYHSLFNFNTRSWINIPVFLCYILVLLINLWYYRRLLAVQFVALFSSVYTVAIFYTLMLQTFSPLEVAIQGFAHERYFVFLRVCSFVLLVSSLNILFKYLCRSKNYRKLMAYSCFILCLVLFKHYALNDCYIYMYYDDIRKLELAKEGETVTIHSAPSKQYSVDLRKHQ